MGWFDPSSVTTGDLITAATWNQDVVDNAQYLHDNRFHLIVLGSNPDTAWGGNETDYTIGGIYANYKGSIIDEADLNAAYFGVYIWGDNSTCDVFARLLDATAGASVIGTELTHSSTSHCTLLETSDIKANLPTGDVTLGIEFKSSNAATDYRCSWAGLWLDF